MTGFWKAFAEDEQSELFFADLMGWRDPGVRSVRPARLALPAARTAPVIARPAIGESIVEAVAEGGCGRLAHAPLGGPAAEHVEARWNVDAALPSGTSIDVVVHLHGYGHLGKEPNDAARHAAFLQRKAAEAGVDLVDAAGAPKRVGRPTLALVPRGRHDGGRVWYFDTLPNRAAFDALVDRSLLWLCTNVLKRPATGATLPRGRLILMAHSGGGASMNGLLNNGVDPDEVVCFDSLYGGHDAVLKWASAKIASPAAARSALRVFYTACRSPAKAFPGGQWSPRPDGKFDLNAAGSWSYSGKAARWRLETTEVSARRLLDGLTRALSTASNGAALAGRFRVERTTVAHGAIPARYSPLLLEDITATLPGAAAPPPPTDRPACVANDNWLSKPPVKPFGDAAPPPKPSPVSELVEPASDEDV
ncbi:MAG: hypothetical protein Q8O42_13835 [Acidobacteriota bacterium]|nr:hypothetical protein [Acidobacteriota bacterium]